MQDYAGASALAENFRRTGFKDVIFDTFDATLDVLNHRSDLARVKFESVVDRTSSEDEHNKAYVHEYSLYYIALMDGRAVDAEAHRNCAHKLEASKFVRKVLPIPNEEVQF